MEGSPYIDAPPSPRREPLLNVVGAAAGDVPRPSRSSTVPTGFVLDEARPPVRFALTGCPPFAACRWVFELAALALHPAVRADLREVPRPLVGQCYSDSWNSTMSATAARASLSAVSRSAADGADSTV